jgi:putative protease
MTGALRKPELLAPAGDRLCVRAATENGADAVYFGLQSGFNARARACNFALEELPEMLRELHLRGVKGYATLNTLVFSRELDEIEPLVHGIADAGVDAVLVQDLGLVQLIRAIRPELAIHASTQMTMTSAECIAMVQSLGVERVVLARELSLEEIRRIAAQTAMPLEVFVHGALCVAYSGQCLTSESLGGRSANRGQCAQACRLPYDLICDGRDVDLGDVKYLLSPQDLAAYDLVPQLIDAGVACFKIEGRLKTPEYVANITSHYRQAIDAALAGRPVILSPADQEEMELSFSRGFSPGWLEGCEHKRLVPGLSSAKRGVLLGEVVDVQRGSVAVKLRTSIAAGDGVVFQGNRAADEEQGGRVFEVRRAINRASPRRAVSVSSLNQLGSANVVDSNFVELTFQHGAIDFEKIVPGQQIWKTDDPRHTARWRKTFTAADPQRRVPLDLCVTAQPGQPLRVRATADSGAACDVESSQPLEAAIRHPLNEELLRKQLGRLGGSVYELRGLSAAIEGDVMLPLSVLGALRHELVRRLDESIARCDGSALSTGTLADLRVSIRARPEPSALPSASATEELQPAELHVLCRSLAQLCEVLAAGQRQVYADLADIREYRDAVRAARQAGAKIWLATPRIQKPNEMGIFRAMAKHDADGLLVRNFAGLQFCVEHGIRAIADFSLNATNELTLHWLRDRGAERVTASYDMNREQLFDLVSAAPPELLEVVIHQHMPMFHMEHCVFCAVLSPGTNKHNCGRPCDVHQVKLRDRIGMEHRLTADVGCRNTLFNAIAQSAAEATPQLVERGVRHLRVELLDETGDELGRIVSLYRELLAGRARGRDVWMKLSAMNRVGVTRGTLEERRDPLAIL